MQLIERVTRTRTAPQISRDEARFYRRSGDRQGLRGLFWGTLAPVALVGAMVATSACTTTPVTGRSTFNMLSLAEDKDLGGQAYGELLAEAKFITSGRQYDMVQQVVADLVAVADDPGAFDWEVRLVDDESVVNAWCLPGGKMAVYTGILPYTQTSTGLAVVMGHEIGHAVARHGTERMSKQMGLQVVLDYAGGEYGAEAQQLGAAAANVLLFLPWGRDHELEADHIGLVYMARAGYDPQEAVSFWTRMAGDQGEGSKLEGFLSTHPSNADRIRRIERLLPKILREYEESGPPR